MRILLMIKQTLDTINLILDEGIAADIHAFFRENEGIVSYRYNIKEKCYNIHVKMKKFDRYAIKKMFHNFIVFMEYSDATFYKRYRTEKKITYYFITVSNDKKGFQCKVYFE